MGQVVSATVFGPIGVDHVISRKGYQDLCEIPLDPAASSDTPSSGGNPDYGQNTPNTVEFVSQTFGISLVIVYPSPGVWISAILIC